jgi:hypothetical protein
MRRVLRYDGLLPNPMTPEGEHRKLTPKDIRAMKAYVEANRTATTPFDIIVEGTTPGGNRMKAAAAVRRWAEAGATWWMEAMWSAPDLKAVLKRIQQGPPEV